jgi:hypothetical protein
MEAQVFDGDTLEAALINKTLAAASVDLVGMVKASEKQGYVGFSKAGCESWIDLPVSMIERAVHRGSVSCRDHSHPLFEISLKEPSDPQGKILLALLGQFVAGNTTMSGSGVPTPGVLPNAAGMFSPQLRGGGGGLLGGTGVFGWGSTLPSCSYEVQYAPCGSPLPGYPTPMCPTVVYCCTWPNGTKSCM